ncbi:DNA repair protein RecN [Geothermobacter hydrogeniphilus]|uniref:DNA repair protein RecN n=1 Tax=Geothermobacter hydrogeniphilus TaxID=1969733 RepID=A0A2K2H877_9BACT|nr:DNA repair protein RecN [Geothermobacter hydrogeniphilus]PNU19508.1 DNA repair protein RecN [Geothermobacter hydrogeniphilus]
MLTELIIRNFAIIDRLEVSFGPGFNVLTGETGAGKSIIIDAVGLLLGDRARPEVIRTGAEEATVEGLFDLSGLTVVKDRLAKGGFEAVDELLIKRVVSRSGKNRIFLNGSLARLSQLQDIAAGLVNIYGQHEHQRLQKTDTHLKFLDRFAGLEKELAAYADLYSRVAALRQRLEGIDQGERDRRQRIDFLRFQQREIAAAALQPGEDEELERERLLLQHSEKLTLATGGGYEQLYGRKGAVCEILDRVAADLEGLATVDSQLGELADTVRGSLYQLEDVAVQLRGFAGRLNFEPGRQNEVEERLAQIAALKRKYAPTIEEILAGQVRIEAELAELTDADTTREGLLTQLTEARQALQKAGDGLSRKRQAAARKLASGVMRELADLALPKARFECHFIALEEPGPFGLERMEFYLAPNPGEDMRPLAWIASGGELSRIMLAIKRIAPDADGVSTLIFDEVDAGIGGAAASSVGAKLQQVADQAQVLCITHLPQVAAFGDAHYRVEKMVDNGRTFTALVALKGETRVREMARMLGGARITERTLEHAREMIESGQNLAGKG